MPVAELSDSEAATALTDDQGFEDVFQVAPDGGSASGNPGSSGTSKIRSLRRTGEVPAVDAPSAADSPEPATGVQHNPQPEQPVSTVPGDPLADQTMEMESLFPDSSETTPPAPDAATA
jgi:hypothetical protein